MIQIGDIVEVIDETLQGKVIQVDKTNCTLQTEDGFSLKFPINQVVNVSSDGIRVNYQDSLQAIKEKETKHRRRRIVPKSKEKNQVRLEIDLHIGQLIDSMHNMTNYDMLTLQIETARKQLEFAIANRIQRIVFIHGVGEGVLRTELEYLFGRYENITFYDAEYSKYGFGATEVYIYQSKTLKED